MTPSNRQAAYRSRLKAASRCARCRHRRKLAGTGPHCTACRETVTRAARERRQAIRADRPLTLKRGDFCW